MKEYLLSQIQKYTEGKLSLQEQLELSDHLADKQNHVAEQVLREEWIKTLQSESAAEVNLKPVLDRVHHRIHQNEAQKTVRISYLKILQRIAAVLFIPLSISFFAYYYLKEHSLPDQPYAEIQCPMGARIKFQLPDGSIGFLNSGSKLRYEVQFSQGRKVDLLGEAYFEIIHNEEKPFHVNTKNLDIKVLGTTFDVIANEDETIEQIVLQTGKVNISTHNGQELSNLTPNEELTFNTHTKTYSLSHLEASQYTAWKEGKLVFRNENMKQVAQRLSRWYNAEMIVDDKQLESYTFHATFIDEPLDEVLKLLSLTTPLSYREEERTTDDNGAFKKRKIILSIDRQKINQFK